MEPVPANPSGRGHARWGRACVFFVLGSTSSQVVQGITGERAVGGCERSSGVDARGEDVEEQQRLEGVQVARLQQKAPELGVQVPLQHLVPGGGRRSDPAASGLCAFAFLGQRTRGGPFVKKASGSKGKHGRVYLQNG
jgi:hypothetical protein